MRVFVMRHGEAQHSVGSDRDRQLTPVGQSQSRQSGLWLHQQCDPLQPIIELALVSPFVRAQQTFAALSEAVNVKQMISSSDVVPSGDAALAQSYIDYLVQAEEGVEHLLIVSHMPFVSYLLDQLCGRHHSLLFATGAIAEVHYDPAVSRGELVRQYTPEM